MPAIVEPVAHGLSSLAAEGTNLSRLGSSAYAIAIGAITIGAIIIGTIVLLGAGCVSAQPPPGATQIQHVVFILKENHTFDNYFGNFPGADGVTHGVIHTGQVIPLGPSPNLFTADIGHTFGDALLAMDHGKMDKFDLIPGAFQHGRLANYTQFQQSQLPNYWALASRFAIADEFFTSVHGPSFPNHLFTIAAQSGNAINNPVGGNGTWGCDSPYISIVQAIDPTGMHFDEFPCFDFPTVADSLNTAGLSWRYYGATTDQG